MEGILDHIAACFGSRLASGHAPRPPLQENRWMNGASNSLAVVTAAVIVLSLPSAARAAEYVVNNRVACADTSAGGTTVKPFCTISYPATKRVLPGDKVIVRPGNYPERAKFSRSGTSGAEIVFSADPGVTVGSGQDNGLYFSGVGFIRAEGFTVSGTIYQGVKISLSHNITLNNVKVFDSSDRGIYLTDSSNVAINASEVDGSLLYGIQAKNCSNFRLSGSTVSHSGRPTSTGYYKGIYIGGCSSSKLDNNIVKFNTDSGIYLVNGTTGVEVRGNTAFGNAREFTRGTPGIEVRGTNGNLVDSNISYDNEDSGIQLYSGANDNTVINNLSYNNGDHGIDNLRSLNSRIIDNTVYNNVTAGINVEGNSTGATVVNNISVDNGIDSPRTEGNIRIEVGSTAGTIVDYNLVWLTRQQGVAKMYTYNSVEYRTLAAMKEANPGVEKNGIEDDPDWASATAGNFELTTGSPAINKAGPTPPAPTYDITGQSRAGQPDIGAYEF